MWEIFYEIGQTILNKLHLLFHILEKLCEKKSKFYLMFIIEPLINHLLNRTYSTVKFDKAMRSVEEVFDNERNAKLNNDRLNFVSNILGQGNFLVNNRFDKRILIGRGPVTISNNVMKKV